MTPLERKTDISCPSSKMSSPAKAALINKFEDYNDSGYGCSPLPLGNSKQSLLVFVKMI